MRNRLPPPRKSFPASSGLRQLPLLWAGRRFVAAALAGIAWLIVPTLSWGQTTSIGTTFGAGPGTPSATAEGPGVRLGEKLVLHPTLGLLFGHDSNVFFSSSGDPRTAAVYLTLRPALDLATRGPARDGAMTHTLDFRLHAGAAARFLLTRDQAFNRRYISVDVDVTTQLTLFPARAWTFEVFDNLNRLSTPPYYRTQPSVPADQPGNINYVQNDFGFRLRWRPGRGVGGKLGRLETDFTYRLGLFAFESGLASRSFTDKNYISNDFQLRGQWKFFPKTAVYLNIQETIYSYYNRDAGTPPTNYPLRVTAGLTGLVLPKLQIDVNAGYGNGFYRLPASCTPLPTDPRERAACTSPQSAVVGADINWRPRNLTSLTVGYRRNFAVALIGSYYNLDAATLDVRQQIWRIPALVRLAWEQRRFQGNLATDSFEPSRRDNIFLAHIEFSYPIRPWLVASVGDDVLLNRSNCQFIVGGTTTSALSCNFTRNDFLLKIAGSY